MPVFDALIVGGGLYGAHIAYARAAAGANVVLLERGDTLLGRASYGNQARVHHGYHYPRSFRTAVRARADMPRFMAEFGDCIDRSFDKYYAISRRLSKVSARQFELFCRRIEAPLDPAPTHIAGLFSRERIEAVYRVEEYAFDAEALRRTVARRLDELGVDVRLGHEARRIGSHAAGGLAVLARSGDREEEFRATRVICCAYSQTNRILAHSGLPLIPLKHEVAEIALIDPPEPLRGLGVTVMCGPFFSTMPFPPRDAHSLSHVRYTPHASWEERPGSVPRDPYATTRRFQGFTRHREMIQDAARYLPAMRSARYLDSLWEVKTVLPRNEMDDGRPIMVAPDHGIEGLTLVLGSKIDSVYDVTRFIERDHLVAV